MGKPTYAVLVKLGSELDEAELLRRMRERVPEFRALDGLTQKYYLKSTTDPGTYGGFYLWQSLEDVQEYRSSELAATIGSAYEAAGAPSIEVFEILMPLRE